MAVPVNVFVTSDAAIPAPLPGVSVMVLTAGTVVAGAALTDADGMAAFSLPGGDYEVRFFKLGVVFQNPFSISVLEPATSPNGFEATGTVIDAFGVPSDQRLCRCVGRFVNYANQPQNDVLIRVVVDEDLSTKMPKLVDNNMVAPSSMEFHTDRHGYAVLDLIRGGEFYMSVAGEEDQLWAFKVPDRPSASLLDLIHARPVSVAYGDLAPTVAVGSAIDVSAVVSWTDFRDRPGDVNAYLRFMISDPTLAEVAYNSSQSVLNIRGLMPGSFTITAEPVKDTFPHVVPDTTISAPVVNVTITP